MSRKKIITLSSAIRLSVAYRQKGKRVVTTNGSFDLLHAGHVASLEEAKKQGDVLFVLVNSDISVRRYKGPGRPIIFEKARLRLVAALEAVDHVLLFDDLTPVNALSAIKSDIHCNGNEWGRDCIERGVVEQYGGKIHVLSPIPGLSTSALLKKTDSARSKKQVRAVFIDGLGTIAKNKGGYIHKKQGLEFEKESITSLCRLSRTSYKIIVITNQTGIRRGLYTERAMARVHRNILKKLRTRGVRIDTVYHCPHHLEAGCACWESKIDIILKAAGRFGLNLSKSVLIGDSPSATEAGRRVNLHTYEIGRRKNKGHMRPHMYVTSLYEAVRFVLASNS